MRLNHVEREELLNRIPSIELSYEAIVHKKVYNFQIASIIPVGIRHLVWFTTYHDQNVCFFLELNDHNKIVRIKTQYYVCFDTELSYGTILYGTLFMHNSTTFFSTQDVLYYKGINMRKSNANIVDRLNILADIFQYHIKQVSYFRNHVVMAIPVTHTCYQSLLQIAKSLPYPVEYIQFKYLHRQRDNSIVNMKYVQHNRGSQENTNRNTNNPKNDHFNKELVFKVTPDIQNDIYHLHYYDPIQTPNDIYYACACIPDYNTSVLMNRLFRNIKENRNLDALEESDDDEEFEDDRIDKFVFLEKSHRMVCAYNFKHKKWVPLRVAPKDSLIVTKKYLPT